MNDGPFNGYRDCMPANKVAFMKTHKCASTSIQNILMRYGLNHDLNFVLPLTGHYLVSCLIQLIFNDFYNYHNNRAFCDNIKGLITLMFDLDLVFIKIRF